MVDKNLLLKALTNLRRAQVVFEKFRIDMKDDRDKAGATQAFEFCYELSWKTMRRFLQERGVEVNSPEETFRKAALEGIIKDPEIWFVYQEIRNLTVHTYEESALNTIINHFDNFSKDLYELIKTLEALH